MSTTPTNNDLLLQHIQGIIDAERITKVDRLHVAVCGEKKSGKSWLIAKTARKPLYHCDFDDRKESIAGSKDVFIKQYLDVDAMMPSAWNNLESDVGTLEYLKSKNELTIKSFALDSITFLRQIAENQMMKETGMMRKYKVGTQVYPIAQGWDSVVNIQKMLSTLIARLFALDIDIYAVFHTRPEKDKSKSTKEETVYTDRLTVEPQNLDMLLPKFNETWRCYIDESDEFQLQVRANWKFNAATAMQLDTVEKPNITAMLEKHAERSQK